MQGAFTRLGEAVLLVGLFGGTPSRRQSAEALALRLKQARIRLHLFDASSTVGRPSEIVVPSACLLQELAELSLTEVVICLPPQLSRLAMTLLRSYISGSPRVIAFWDSLLREQMAVIRDAASELHEVWVPTTYLAAVLIAALPNFAGPIEVVQSRTGGCIGDGQHRVIARRRLELPEDAFLVAAELDMEEPLDGQNLSGNFAAFKTAVGDDPNAFLILRCDAHGSHERVYCELDELATDARIRVIDTRRHYLPRAAFLRAADVWLSLHRYPADPTAGIDDALAAGLQVVACARGVGAALWRHPAVHLVRFRSSTEKRANWVTPDLVHAASLLRKLRYHGD